MNSFLLAAAALLIVVLAVLLWPLWRRTAAQLPNSNPALKILREQRADLEAERADGRVDEAAYAKSLTELERRALEESTAPEQTSAIAPARVLAVVLAVMLPVASLALYLILGNPPALDPANRIAQAPSEQTVTPAQIDAMVAKLAARLKANPNDIEGAQMLGRSYMVMGRFKEAADVYANLSKIKAGDAQVFADWAAAVAAAQGNQFAGEPEKLIAQALALDPQNIKALALSGTLAYERTDYQQAVTQWEKIESRVDPQSSLGQSLQVMLAGARQRAGLPQQAQQAATPPLTITGRVTLAPALQSKLHHGDTLFIFARPAGGGRPIAALRLKASDLPADFDFSKAQSMGSFSPQDKVIIGARISHSGTPTSSSGDLQGFSVEVKTDARKVQVRIDNQVK